MVFTTILACFLDNMINFAFFSFKFWIRHPYSIYKIIRILILLSASRVLISSVIFEGERSFNHTSTASRLMFAHPLSFHNHHPPPRHPNSPPNDTRHPARSPSPLLRDVGPIDNTSASFEARTKPQPPLLFPTGCGRLLVARRRNWGVINVRGDPGSGRPNRYVMKTKYDESCTSFSPIPLSHFPH